MDRYFQRYVDEARGEDGDEEDENDEGAEDADAGEWVFPTAPTSPGWVEGAVEALKPAETADRPRQAHVEPLWRRIWRALFG